MSRYRASAAILPRVAFHPVVSGCSAREYLPRRVYLDIFRVWVNHCLAEAAVCSPAPAPTAKSPISEITTAEINNPLGAPRKPHFPPPTLRDQVDQLFGDGYVACNLCYYYHSVLSHAIECYFTDQNCRLRRVLFLPMRYSLSKLPMFVVWNSSSMSTRE